MEALDIVKHIRAGLSPCPVYPTINPRVEVAFQMILYAGWASSGWLLSPTPLLGDTAYAIHAHQSCDMIRGTGLILMTHIILDTSAIQHAVAISMQHPDMTQQALVVFGSSAQRPITSTGVTAR